jgi:thioredoxin 1
MQFFTDGSLEDAVRGADAVVVAFAASWCCPSQTVTAALAGIAEEQRPGLKVGVVDVDEHPTIPARYGVRGLPTTMLFKDGLVASTRLGQLSPRQLREWVDDLI